MLQRIGGSMLSNKFKERIKLSEVPAYKLAWAVNIHPDTLSKYISGYLKPKLGDPRIIEIGRVLGLNPKEIFENPGVKS